MNINNYQENIKVHHRLLTEDMEGFEFEINESIMIDEQNQIESSYFRLESHKTGEKYVVVASSDEYFIFEDATGFFDISTIEAQCRLQWESGTVCDSSTDYIQFLKDCEAEEMYA